MNSDVQTRTKRPRRYVVCRVEDFPESGRLLVSVNGREVGVFRVDGGYFAMLNRCPHLGGPLCLGQLVNKVSSPAPGVVDLDRSQTLLTCPYHNWEFDIRTGQSYFDPDNLHARAFPIEVEGGAEVQTEIDSGKTGMVKGPYQAEMVDVAVDDDYIVLSFKARARQAAKPSASADDSTASAHSHSKEG